MDARLLLWLKPDATHELCHDADDVTPVAVVEAGMHGCCQLAWRP
jgi:hypothetical protein